MDNSLKAGPISETDLMMKLVNAKKIMNMEDGQPIDSKPKSLESLRESAQPQQPKIKPVNNGKVDVDRINNSKLPEAIKNAMIENPIPTISLNETVDMSFLDGAKRLFEREGLSTKQPISESKQRKPIPQSYETSSVNNDSLVSMLTPIIENIIRKSIDEIVEKKIDKLLSINQSVAINENLVLKVGDSVFKGKITGVNKPK